MLPTDDIGLGGRERVRVNDIMRGRHAAGALVDGLEGRARAILQVQNGCDHRCTFCIIPFGRGHSRSVPLGAVVEQARRFVENGYREIVLTGVDLTSYGADLAGTPRLGDLVEALLLQLPELARLRLSSIDQVEADPLLVELLKGEMRLMPHLHLSLQAGDDLTLKRMKRRHSRAEAIHFCAELRAARPDFAFGADLIVGFPTETEAMFANTLKLVEECGLAYLHVFPFSPRAGTPAARMPPVPAAEIKARAGRLREAGRQALRRHLERRVGIDAEILVERGGQGRLADFTRVTIDRPVPVGSLVPVQVIGQDGERLVGRVREALA